jgi:hypothetical protein
MLSSPLLVPTIFPVDPDSSSIVVDDPVLNSLVDIPFAGVTSHPVPFEYTAPLILSSDSAHPHYSDPSIMQ